jgi:hypothetical protein
MLAKMFHIYQILNHYTSRQDLDPGFDVLDNSSNERPDWFEYWPMRRFLLNEKLDEESFYGFLSPKFQLKTNLTSGAVRAFMEKFENSVDVFLFSPSVHNSAYFWNVFEHGESEHPGLLRVATKLFERIKPGLRLGELVSDSRNTVHANFFIAKPRFWRAWLEVNERMFAIAETPSDPLSAELCAATSYRGGKNVAMKIFIMERVATLLLTCDRTFRARVRDPFASRSRIYKLPVAILCDALKIAYTIEGRGQYKDVFFMVRALQQCWNFQIRLSEWLGLGRVRPYLRTLKSYWLEGSSR